MNEEAIDPFYQREAFSALGIHEAEIGRSLDADQFTRIVAVAQKGAGGNPGAVTKKGGDQASGSTGTGRGGGKKGNASKKG